MQEVRIVRLCREPPSLMLQSMKKALHISPTPDELYALEKRARHERALALAALLKSFSEWARSAFSAKAIRHA